MKKKISIIFTYKNIHRKASRKNIIFKYRAATKRGLPSAILSNLRNKNEVFYSKGCERKV